MSLGAVQEASGELHRSSGAVQVCVLGSTSYALFIRAARDLNGARDFDELVLQLGAERIRLGRCRFLPAVEEADRRTGHLVFLEEVCDLHALLRAGERRGATGGHFNVPLILSRKDRVHPRFKEYSANLHFEFSVYKQFFDQLDRKLAGESADVRAELQRLTLEREGADFLAHFDGTVDLLKDLTGTLNPEEQDIHGYFFRQQVWDFIMDSRLLSRTNLKPKGFAGDFQMLQMIYEDRDEGDTIFSRLMHRYPLRTGAAEAVRSRRRLLPKLLNRARVAKDSGRAFRVLSLASGEAVELGDYLTGAEVAEGLELTLLDQDAEALDAARHLCLATSKRIGRPVKAQFRCESVRTLLRRRDPGSELGEYDFIYSMGLFDYLTPPTATALVHRLASMLCSGGRLVIGNYHVSNPDRAFMEYWADWTLFYRNEAELVDLTSGLPLNSHNLFFEDTGCQMFLEVQKI